jgi:putative restriction endonuclease
VPAQVVPPTAVVGITDRQWFESLRRLPGVDEVNFWQPSPGRAFAALQPGEPFLFKLHSPVDQIVGGGFYARYERMPISVVWDAFGAKNGAGSLEEMRKRVEHYRRPATSMHGDYEIGCILLEQPFFLDQGDWLPVPDWSPNIQRYRRYRLDEEPGRSLWRAVERLVLRTKPDSSPGMVELAEAGAERYGAPTFVRPRLGQGSFQLAVVGAYGRRCAFTGEKVLPALEAAHIRPYGEGGEHRVDNGLLLRRDVHALFDRGYITVTPELEIVVSKRLRQEFDNGDQYLAMGGHQLRPPTNRADRPNSESLVWHNQNRFVA